MAGYQVGIWAPHSANPWFKFTPTYLGHSSGLKPPRASVLCKGFMRKMCVQVRSQFSNCTKQLLVQFSNCTSIPSDAWISPQNPWGTIRHVQFVVCLKSFKVLILNRMGKQQGKTENIFFVLVLWHLISS